MNTKTKSHQRLQTFVFVCAFLLMTSDVFGLGSDYPNDRLVTGAQIKSWPDGMLKLVDSPNRVHGFWENSEEIFFFSGSVTDFSAFLRAYSQIQGIEKHCLILHDGTGEAKSPWQTNSRPCDWQIYGCPKGWHNLFTLKGTNSVEAMQKAAKEPGYILEVHFWTSGHIALDQVSIPKNISRISSDSPDLSSLSTIEPQDSSAPYDGEKRISKALEIAKRDGKRVLIQSSAEGCGWCHVCNKLLTANPEIIAKINSKFVYVLVDTTNDRNRDFYKKHARGTDHTLVLVVLDTNGKNLTQSIGFDIVQKDPLHPDNYHITPEHIMAFLNKWSPKI